MISAPKIVILCVVFFLVTTCGPGVAEGPLPFAAATGESSDDHPVDTETLCLT